MRKIILVIILFQFAGCGLNSQNFDEQILENKDLLNYIIQEITINEYLQELSDANQPQSVVFENVNLISMIDDQILKNQTVLVEYGVIKAIGKHEDIKVSRNTLTVNGNGQYLLPGLTDMHVHTMKSNDQKLLNLANGITTVRELCGFNWTLKVRESISKNKILAPNLYLSGTMRKVEEIYQEDFVSETPTRALEDLIIYYKSQAQGFLLKENYTNRFGYLLLGLNRTGAAIDILKINTEKFPNSFNAFDSLAEAYMRDGDDELAIKNYQKSLQLNPGNENAKAMIEKIKNG